MKKIISSALFVLALSVASCQNQTNKSGGNLKIINTTISVDDFDKKLSETPTAQLVDVRTPEEYIEGHLVNALNYNLNATDFENNLSKLDKNKPVMVYCLGGGRSAEAAEIMANNGFIEVYNMQGGIMKWNAANKPLDKNAVNSEGKGMSLADFNKAVTSDKYVLVDFNAKWCKPCKKMAPMLESIADKKKDKLIFIKIDADENKELLKEKHIEAIPFFELYKDGKLVWKHQGEIDEATLLKETNL
ncbi:MAG: thioredoxin domain-containing protein [Bacteroidia bacterium]